MYVWQMSDGRWHVSNYTHVQYDVRMRELVGYETKEEAYEALRVWRAKYPDIRA